MHHLDLRKVDGCRILKVEMRLLRNSADTNRRPRKKSEDIGLELNNQKVQRHRVL